MLIEYAHYLKRFPCYILRRRGPFELFRHPHPIMAFTIIAMVDIIMVSLFLHFLLSFRDHIRRRGHPYPPGPKPSPIIGNLLDSPKQSQWTAYAEMSKK